MTTESAGDVENAPGTAVRRMELDGVTWLVRIAGQGAGGSGALGLAMIEAVEFRREGDSVTPPLEALVQRGSFALMHDAELRTLFTRAQPAPTRRVSTDTRRSMEDDR